MKVKALLFAIGLGLIISNITALYAVELQEEKSLKYLYDRYITVGLEYLKNKKYDQAKFEFEKSQLLFPQFPESYLNLATIQIYRFDYEGAEKLLNQAKERLAESQNQEYLVFYNLGLCAYQQQNYQAAHGYFSHCLELKPGLNEAEQGLTLTQQKIGRKPVTAETTEVTAEENLKADKTIYGEKLERITESLKAAPDTSYSRAADLLKEGSRRFENDQTAEAIELIQQSLALVPDNPQALYRLGVIYTHLNKFEEAEYYFEAAIKNNPSFLNAYINLGGVYGKLKKYPQALQILNQALKIDPDNAKIYYNLGMVNSGLGKTKEAKKYFKKARAICQKSGDLALLEKIPKL